MQWIRCAQAEVCFFGRLLFSRKSNFLAKLAAAAGFTYLFVPLDIIPDRIPLFGHFDEAGAVLCGILLARLLICAPSNDTQFERRLDFWLCRRLGYRRWWLLHTPTARQRSTLNGLVVVGGAARSGTTMLRSILGRHPMIASGPETTVFLKRITSPCHLSQRLGWAPGSVASLQRRSFSQVEFIEQFYEAVQARTGRSIWLEKTPANVFRFGFVRRSFPNAKLIHVVRDGRDAVCSLRSQPWSKVGSHIERTSAEAYRKCARLWVASVRAGLAHRNDPNYFEVRYEDLISHPVETLSRLLEFLELPWSDRLLDEEVATSFTEFSADWPTDVRQSFERDFIAANGRMFPDSVGRWRRDLSLLEQAALMPLIGPLLVELGYEIAVEWKTDVERGSRNISGQLSLSDHNA
jgi:protein-tyrosine sulfotransferase